MRTDTDLGIIVFAVLLGFGLWFVVFYLQPLNFWLGMGTAVFVLSAYALVVGGKTLITSQLRPDATAVVTGIISAGGLYVIFLVGNWLARMIFPFGGSDIDSVYALSHNTPLPVIGILLTLVIGPGEELFWRGTVQRKMYRYVSGVSAVLLTAGLYAFVHIWTLNLVLILAAFICGLFWGFLYFYRDNLTPAVISHSLWSLMIFVLLPVG